MTADQRRRTIARWVGAGLPYRTWTVRETTLVLNEQLIQDLFDADETDLLRNWLTLTGDKSRLGALDRDTMGQTNRVEVQDTPPLRGR